MIPVILELHNFLAYRDPAPLSFEGIHVACISGENGAGKSTLFDAITWALWGKARADSADDLIHQNRRDARVALTFDMGGSRYQVIRQRSIEKKTAMSLLEFQVFDRQTDSWRSLSEHNLRATQDRIQQVLRLDYDTFINSALLAQGRADEFTAKPPSQRVQILAAILGLDRWAVYEDRAKEKARAAREANALIEARMRELEGELARRSDYLAMLERSQKLAEQEAKKLAELEAAWATLEQQRAVQADLERQTGESQRRKQTAEKELEEARRELDTLGKQLDAEALEKSIQALKNEQESLAAKQSDLESWQVQLREQVDLAGRLKGENDSLGPQTEPLKKRLETLETTNDPACPTCGQPLTADHREKVMSELRAEIQSRRDTFRENAARIKTLSTDIEILQKKLAEGQSALRALPAVEKRLAEATAGLEAAKSLAERIPALQERVARWRKGALEEDATLKVLQEKARSVGGILADAEKLRRELEAARLEKRLADERVGGARQNIAALDAMEKQLLEKKSEADALRRSQSLYEELRDAFGKRGVPTLIIETVVPELEQEANRLLAEMSGGRMRLRMETERETKTGDARDTLDLFISDELGTRAYELYSGGEAFRINFAIRISLSRLLARRAGAQLRALFIDEGFGTQDASGREKLVSAIQSIQEDFDLILVITHLDELREAFPARIEVTKTPDGSQVRVV